MGSQTASRSRADARQRGAAQVPPARQPGRQGRPLLKGAELLKSTEIAARATFKSVTVTGPEGRERTVHVHELRCLWYQPFYTRAVKDS